MSKSKITFYPKTKTEYFISDIYKKREFHLYKIPKRVEINDYDDLKELRNTICQKSGEDFDLLPQQKFLRNFINPDTPYTGLLMFHGTGVGKTCAAIQIAEQFKTQVEKYGTKIYIVVSGPILEQNIMDELLGPCTGDTYLPNSGEIGNVSPLELKKAKILISQYYEIITYKKLLRKVLGEKIRNESKDYIRDETGKILRDVSVNRITSLSNTIIIVDEAHNISDNDFGRAIQKIVHNKSSKNLRLVLLTATPMSNYASDIIFLMNLIRPPTDPILINSIFEKKTINTYNIKIKPGGLDYFRKMIKGYVSYLRGADPLTFAFRNDIGSLNKNHQFTKLVTCKLTSIQLLTYLKLSKIFQNDPLSINLLSASNIVLPDVSSDGKLAPRFGNSGLEKLKMSLKKSSQTINKIIHSSSLFKKSNINYLELSGDNKIIGSIFKLENLKNISCKYYEALKNINNNVININDPGTSFVYSRWLGVGIHMFEQILIENGYIDYMKKKDYTNFDNVRCYYCGILHQNHSNIKHIYQPSTYIAITGEKSQLDDIDTQKRTLIKDVFNKENNSTGQFIKIILGSSVLTEGVSIMNIKDVHLLEAPFTLTKIDQIIGRAIRFCSHFDLMSKQNQKPVVNVYKYVVSIDNKIMTQEELIYQKAEVKYKTIKEIERALKESSIDCPLNYHGNIFKDELNEYKDCEKTNTCPAICDFKSCDFKCNDDKIKTFWDKSNQDYINLDLKQIDYSTFSNNLISSEVHFCKNKIKELYRQNYAYTLNQIIDYIKNEYPKNQLKLFDIMFVYKALTELTPVTENDFNNYSDIIYDKYNRECYLIQRDKYYILQQFNMSDTSLMNSRTIYNNINTRNLTLENYIYGKHPQTIIDVNDGNNIYEYDEIYYNSRSEHQIIGIIIGKKDKFSKKNIINDIFNIRTMKDANISKDREKDLPTNFGANCLSKSIPYLKNILNTLNIKTTTSNKKNICKLILNKLLQLEKYSTGPNKLTYIKLPIKHHTYLFPYNIEDRIEYLNTKIKHIFTESQDISITQNKNNIILSSAKIDDLQHSKLEELGGIYKNKIYSFKIS